MLMSAPPPPHKKQKTSTTSKDLHEAARKKWLSLSSLADLVVVEKLLRESIAIAKDEQRQSLDALCRFFDYFRAMHDTARTFRYVDHKGQVHHVKGSSGGQQGHPMEMIRFCATIHPTWGRVSGMSLVNSRALVKRDHIFIGTLICVAPTIGTNRQ